MTHGRNCGHKRSPIPAGVNEQVITADTQTCFSDKLCSSSWSSRLRAAHSYFYLEIEAKHQSKSAEAEPWPHLLSVNTFVWIKSFFFPSFVVTGAKQKQDCKTV